MRQRVDHKTPMSNVTIAEYLPLRINIKISLRASMIIDVTLFMNVNVAVSKTKCICGPNVKMH